MRKKIKPRRTMAMVESLPRLYIANDDVNHAIQRLIDKDVGGCLQCVEFAIQKLEEAKKKLMA